MPPKRRGAQARSAPSDPPAKSIPPPPPPPPPEPEATKVRREWAKFIDSWYEPQKMKLVEKTQKDLLAKYKALGSPKETQKRREMELFERLDAIALQLTQPARQEWERRLDLAQLREDQWNDMSGEEQQTVLSVFVGFFNDVDDDDLSVSIEEDSASEEPPFRVTLSSKQTIPPTPTRPTFEFVNPTSFFTHAVTPPNPAKNLPALSMDHLATLGPSRSAEPVSAGIAAMSAFQNWASEVGQQIPPPSAKPPPAAQTLSARPRATDAISRQASAASASSSSPPLKAISPQFSPHNPPTKFSPPTNAETLPLGKRYIGPVILEEDEDQDPLDEALLKSRMADEYQQYKVSLRIQMIYEFHAKAAEVEIKLFETLLADEGTKESRARAVQEHETNMMRLREQKEEERKRLCAEEREKRRKEMRQHLVQRRREDPAPKPNPPKLADKPSAPRPGKTQKENVPVPPPPPLASKLELPGAIQMSNSTLSQGEASANEALFANAMAAMRSETVTAPSVLTSAQASLNESIFSNAAAAILAAQGPPGSGTKSTVPPPSAMKKSASGRSQEYDVPQITVSFAEPAAAVPGLGLEPTPTPPAAAAKGKRGKKGQPLAQVPPAKPVVVTETETDAEPPPSSLWDGVTHVARNVWGLGESKPKEWTPEWNATDTPAPAPATAPASSRGANASVGGAKKTVPAAKKGKRVTITEEPDVDADPIVSPLPPQTTTTTAKTKPTKGAWGTVGKSKVVPPVVEESEVEPVAAPAPTLTPSLATPASARSKKAAEALTKSGQKPQLRVAVSEEPESATGPGPAPTPARTTKTRSAWEAPAAVASSTSAGAQVQQPARRGAASASSRSVRVDSVPNLEDEWRWTPPVAAGASASGMPGALAAVGEATEGEHEEDDEDEGDANAWFAPEDLSYWASVMGGSAEETQAVPGSATTTIPTTGAEQGGKHALWTPIVGGESDDEDEMGDADAALATSMWMQYAISGGDVDLPALGVPAVPEPPAPVERAPLARVKKTSSPMPPQASVLDRAGLAGQWPKMENWLSPPARGQNSGSTRVF